MPRLFASHKMTLGVAVGMLLVLLSLVLLGPAPRASAEKIPELQAPAVQIQSNGDVQLLSSDDSGITFRVSVPWDRLTVEPLTGDGSRFVRLSMPGWSVTRQAGEPELPSMALLLGVPFGADLQVDAVPGTASSLSLPSPVAPAPTLRAEWDWTTLAEGHSSLPALISELNPADEIYRSGAAYPGVLAEIADDGAIRQQRVVGIAVYPIQYQPGSDLVTIYHSLTIRIRFGGSPATGVSTHSAPESAAYEELFRTQLLNYDSARVWRQPVQRQTAAIWTPPVPGYKMLVRQEGMYRVTYDDLADAGVPVADLDPSTLQVMNMGEEIAIYVAGEADGSFDPDDYLLFYGQSVTSKYTAGNVYWLTYGHNPGQRMASRDVTPSAGATPPAYDARVYFEESHWYLTAPPGDENLERFLWVYIRPTTPNVPASWSYTFALPSPSADTLTATLQLRLLGGLEFTAYPDHHVQVSVNGHQVADEWWDGFTWYTSTIDLPQSYLVPGNNTVTLTCPNDSGAGVDMVYVDKLNLAYASLFTTTTGLLSFPYDVTGTWKYQINGFTSDQLLAFDISDPSAVEQITGGLVITAGSGLALQFTDQVTAPTTYLALADSELLSPQGIELDTPSNLQSAANGADYILLTHSDFYTAVVPLADYRESQGLRVALIDIQDVYDEFGYGLTGARPIRDFYDHAYHHWQPPAASYTVLVGDGTYDPKNYLGYGRTSFLPPYLAPVDPFIGETAADNRYVALTVGDNMPDMMLGRLAVNQEAEARAIVSKTLAYEQNPPPGDWNQQLMFVSDDGEGFPQASDGIIDCCVPAPYEPERIYYLVTHGTPAAVTAAIVAGINDGRLIVNYIGHGAPLFWAGPPALFHVDNIASLNNGDKLPIMLPMTCWDGYYIYPYANMDAMGERIVRAAGRGAVASWSPTGLGFTAVHNVLNEGFLDALFQDGLRITGQATSAAKLKLWTLGSNHDLLDTYLLFGDPALHVNALDTDLQVTKTVEPAGEVRPGDLLTYTLTFTNAGPATAFHVILTDTIPDLLSDPVVVYASPNVITHTAGVTFAWTIADLPPGDDGVIQVRARVNPAAQTGDTIVNQAQITTAILDLNPANNIASTWTTVYTVAADLQVFKTVEPGSEVGPGDLLTYTVTFTNAGPDAALGVVLTDIIPALLVDPVIVYASPEVLTPTAGITFAWRIADLLPGNGGMIRVQAKVSPAAQPGSAIINQAEIAATTPDVLPANNTMPVTTIIRGPDVTRFYLPLVIKDYP